MTVILAGLAAALLLGGLGVANARASSVAATTWKAQDASSAGSSSSLKSVTFVDATHGWAVGHGGPPVILATSDGGATWKAQDASSAGSNAVLNSVTFTDATHGWAVGEDIRNAYSTTSVILATSK